MPRKKTTEEYIKECIDRELDLPLEDYVNAKTKIKHKCSNGHIYEQTPYNHLYGYGCKKCSILYISTKRIKSPEYYYNECKEKGLDLPVEDYIKDCISIKHQCSDGHIYGQTPSHHLQGSGCPLCNGHFRKTPEQYKQECIDKGLDLPIESYVNNKVKIKHKCNACGYVYKQTPSNHLKGKSCPVCSSSKGEKYIQNYLDKHTIKYTPQKKFKGLKDKQSLSYDFYLPNYDILIEYQGIQHFESVSFNGKDYTDLDKQKHHDRLKQRFAKENEYKLLRPTYKTDTQEKINRYLDKYLLKSLTNN